MLLKSWRFAQARRRVFFKSGIKMQKFVNKGADVQNDKQLALAAYSFRCILQLCIAKADKVSVICWLRILPIMAIPYLRYVVATFVGAINCQVLFQSVYSIEQLVFIGFCPSPRDRRALSLRRPDTGPYAISLIWSSLIVANPNIDKG